MNNILELTLPIPLSVNHLYGHNRFGSVYMKPEGKQYKKQISEIIIKEVEKQKWIKTLNEEYCYLDATVYFDKKGKDCDNIYKVIQDTITESGVVWEDDKYTWSRKKTLEGWTPTGKNRTVKSTQLIK